MKLHKFLTVLILIALSVFLTACAAQVAQLQQLPDEGRLLVLELITATVTGALLFLSGLFKTDLKGYAQPIAAVVSPLAITVIEHYLQAIPSIYDNLVLVVIHYIVLFLGGLATVVVVRRFRNRSVKALLS